jgi:hypothetical protein
MAKEYKEGEKYYLPVVVDEVLYEGKYPVKLTFVDGGGGDSVGIADEPNLLLTADEIATDINTERAEVMENLGNHNLELSKQNEELSARVEELTDLTNYYMAERQRNNLNIRLLLDKIAELEGEKNG